MKYPRTMRSVVLLIASVLVLLSAAHGDPRDAALKELIPTGKLRVAIGVGPAASAFYCTRDPLTGHARGVAVDLAAELARMLRVPVEYVEYPSSGEIVKATGSNAWDVTFIPIDAERERIVDFGPAYYKFESTYLVPAGSRISTIDEVDQPGVRVIGVENTATGRAAASALKRATFVTFRAAADLVEELKAGRADAVALSRESLRNFAIQFPGARVLKGAFFQSRVAVAVPKGHKEALAFVSAFVENAIFTGSVQRALVGAGLKEADIAPAPQTN